MADDGNANNTPASTALDELWGQIDSTLQATAGDGAFVCLVIIMQDFRIGPCTLSAMEPIEIDRSNDSHGPTELLEAVVADGGPSSSGAVPAAGGGDAAAPTAATTTIDEDLNALLAADDDLNDIFGGGLGQQDGVPADPTASISAPASAAMGSGGAAWKDFGERV